MADSARIQRTNGSATAPKTAPAKENIFLFVPNLIGRLKRLAILVATLVAILVSWKLIREAPYRLRACLSRNHLSLLHAPAPTPVFLSVQHLLPPGRSRWCSSAQIQSIYKVRSRVGHGDGQVHYHVPAGLLVDSEAQVEHAIPAAHQSGLYQPLHAHVCHACHGW